MQEENIPSEIIAGRTMSHLSGKYLTFSLGKENYGVEILKVQEIIGVIKITRVPKSPHYLKGVINLRGKIIPVVDLRLKIGLPEKAYDEKTCFIVVNAAIGGKAVSVGVVVDTVLEVTHFEESMIQPAPDYGNNSDTSYILGLGKRNTNVVILIDINRSLESAAGSLMSY
ncbi:MAG: chemotaxis protein CheW [bacterium]|nr:chemotaxis protein CheW [bacterium]